MNTKSFFVLAVGLCGIMRLHAQGTAFTYQGRLLAQSNAANGLYAMEFSLWDALANGTRVAGPVTNSTIAVSNGLFTVTLDFGGGVFTGANRWLGIGVRTNGSSASFTTLDPRQAVTATPYAVRAANFSGTIANSQLPATVARLDSNQTFVGSITFSPSSGAPFGVNNTNSITNLNADLLDGLDAAAFWKLGGNSGTIPGTHFLGTSDDQSLEFRVNGRTAFRMVSTGTNAPNLIGGSSNTIMSGSIGSIIAGGFRNSLTGHYATVSGGNQNNISQERDSTEYSTIAGGFANRIYTRSATVSGGGFNYIGQFSHHASIGGGEANSVDSNSMYAVISGGYFNSIGRATHSATIPGGYNNRVSGSFSLAAGYFAEANHPGTFVWADPSGGLTPFGSTDSNQFLIRASGGVGIGLNNPTAALDVNGRGKMTEFQLGTSATAGSILTADASGVGSWQAPSFVSRSGDTLNGDLTIANPYDLNFGSSTRQMINLYGTVYGIGVQSSTLYMRTDNNFAWFRDGVHDDNAFNPGAGGASLMRLDSAGHLQVNAGVTVDLPAANNGSYYPGLVFGASSGESIASKRTSGGNQYGIDFYTASTPRMSVANNGNVGIGTTTPEDALLDVEGNVHINDFDIFLRGGANRTHGLGYRESAGGRSIGGPFIYGYDGGALGVSSPDSVTFAWDSRDVWVRRNLDTASLNVRSGATIDGGATINGGASINTGAGTIQFRNDNGIAGVNVTGGGVPGVLRFRDALEIWPDDGGTRSGRLDIRGVNNSPAISLPASGNAYFLGGSVGIGTSTPTDALLDVEGDVRMNDHTLWLRGGTDRNHGLRWTTFAGGADGPYLHGFSGGGLATTDGGNKTVLFWDRNGVSINGDASANSFIPTSDRNAKENFKPVNPREVLAKVTQLPITEWQFTNSPTQRHIGPMAQDFHAAFGLGPDDKHIATVDADGVALAAIQGLNQKLEETRAENAELKQRLEKLEQLMTKRTAQSLIAYPKP